MSIYRRLSNLFSRSRMEQDIDAEIQSHLEMRVEDNIASGTSPQKARRDALLRFGNPTAMKERVAAADAALFLSDIWADLSFSLRHLRKNPRFTVAIAALASYLPARRAAGVDPTTALREE